MKPEEKFVHVRVVTTSGDCPEAPAYERVPVNQPVETFLKKCMRKLGLADTNGWILSGNCGPLDASLTWAGLGLVGTKVVLDWGPGAGGGGVA